MSLVLRLLLLTPGAPIDETLFSPSADTWYETESTDDGSFNQTLRITFPLEGVEPSSSLSGVFGTANALGNRVGDTSIPVTIDGLPDGLSVTLTQTSTGVELNLTGNANAHTKKDNASFNLTLLSGFFDTSALYTPADISFSFDIVFGGKSWAPRTVYQAFIYDDKIWILAGNNGTSNYQNDIWSSADSGLTWDEVSPTATHWSSRIGHQSFVYDDKIWVLGGFGDNSYKNDIWGSADSGLTWTEVSPSETHWSSRIGHQSFCS